MEYNEIQQGAFMTEQRLQGTSSTRGLLYTIEVYASFAQDMVTDLLALGYVPTRLWTHEQSAYLVYGTDVHDGLYRIAHALQASGVAKEVTMRVLEESL